MEALISYAIENLQLISFNYESLFRIVEPHCYGTTSKENPAIRAYQVDGESSDGKMGWKLFDLSKAEKVQLIDQKFLERIGYKKGDKGMKIIFKEL